MHEQSFQNPLDVMEGVTQTCYAAERTQKAFCEERCFQKLGHEVGLGKGIFWPWNIYVHQQWSLNGRRISRLASCEILTARPSACWLWSRTWGRRWRAVWNRTSDRWRAVRRTQPGTPDRGKEMGRRISGVLLLMELEIIFGPFIDWSSAVVQSNQTTAKKTEQCLITVQRLSLLWFRHKHDSRVTSAS